MDNKEGRSKEVVRCPYELCREMLEMSAAREWACAFKELLVAEALNLVLLQQLAF